MTSSRRATILVCTLTALVLTACSQAKAPQRSAVVGPPRSTWPMYQYRPDHNAVFSGPLRARWSYKASGEINGGLAIVGDTLYAVTFKNETIALNARSGKVRWIANTARNILMSTPVVTHGLVIVGSGKNQVSADTRDFYSWSIPAGDDIIAYRIEDGAEAWRLHTLGEDMPSVGLLGSTLILANGDMHAYGIDAAAGKVLWKRLVPGVDTMGSTTVAGSTAYTIASMGVPYQYGPNTHVIAFTEKGKILWTAPYGNSDCSPTVADGMVFVEASINHRHFPTPIGGHNEVYGIDAKSGTLRWRYSERDAGYYTSVGSSERAVAGAYSGGVLYQSLPISTEFGAFDGHTGKLLWKFDTEGSVKMSPVISNGLVYFADSDGLFYTVNAKTGRIRNVRVYRVPFSTSPPVIVGKTLFIAGGDTIYAIPLDKL